MNSEMETAGAEGVGGPIGINPHVGAFAVELDVTAATIGTRQLKGDGPASCRSRRPRTTERKTL